tara:strand:+ start:661 stop:1083 length:423 start_codon:yes stop_codon:yes gene_type:complete
MTTFSIFGANCHFFVGTAIQALAGVTGGRVVSYSRGSGYDHRTDVAILEFDLVSSDVAAEVIELARLKYFSCELREAAPSSSAPVDLSVLDLSVPKLEAALKTGKHDADLDALLTAERAGKTRKTAVQALEVRKAGTREA